MLIFDETKKSYQHYTIKGIHTNGSFTPGCIAEWYDCRDDLQGVISHPWFQLGYQKALPLIPATDLSIGLLVVAVMSGSSSWYEGQVVSKASDGQWFVRFDGGNTSIINASNIVNVCTMSIGNKVLVGVAETSPGAGVFGPTMKYVGCYDAGFADGGGVFPGGAMMFSRMVQVGNNRINGIDGPSVIFSDMSLFGYSLDGVPPWPLTNERCNAVCAGNGFQYSATAPGGESTISSCYCDFRHPATFMDRNDTVCTAESSPCNGDKSEVCGGLALRKFSNPPHDTYHERFASVYATAAPAVTWYPASVVGVQLSDMPPLTESLYVEGNRSNGSSFFIPASPGLYSPPQSSNMLTGVALDVPLSRKAFAIGQTVLGHLGDGFHIGRISAFDEERQMAQVFLDHVRKTGFEWLAFSELRLPCYVPLAAGHRPSTVGDAKYPSMK